MAELGVFGVGVATADPELRHVGEKKTAVCTVNLAFNRSYKSKDDKWENEPCFVRAQVWGTRAERMSELVKKGQPIYVCGYLKQDSWEADDGTKRVSYSITLRDFQLCQKNTKSKNNESQSVETAASTSPPVDASEVPF